MKIKLICAILALVVGTSSLVYVVTSTDGYGQSDPLPPVDQGKLVSTLLEKPLEGDISTQSAKDNLYIAHGELIRSGGFVGNTLGSSNTMGVSQGVASSRVVMGQSVFKQSVSHSSFVQLAEQRYVHNNNYIIRAGKASSLDKVAWSDTASPVSKEAYLERYGYIGDGLSGFVLNDYTITDAQLVSQDDGLYTFSYTLDTEIAPYFLLSEMKTSANTKSYPTFLKASFQLTMDSNWKVISITSDNQYKVAMLGGVVCDESITETFSQIGEVTQLPHTEFFSQYFGAEPVVPLPEGPDSLQVLMDIFAPYIAGEHLNARMTVEGGQLDNLSALINLQLDIENTDNIVANIRLGELDLTYADNNIYLQYQDTKGSIAVDGAIDAVGSIMSLFGVQLDSGAGFDVSSLLGGLVLNTTEDGCTVSLDLPIGDMLISAVITATTTDSGYAFDDLVITLGDTHITIVLADSWDVTPIEGDYPNILGILDLLQEGKLAMEVEVLGYNIFVQYDIKTSVLYASCPALDLTVTLQDKVIYGNIGELGIKVAIEDIQDIVDFIMPLLGEVEMPAVDIDINEILNSLQLNNSSESIDISVSLLGAVATVKLAVVDNNWTLSTVQVQYQDLTVKATPATAIEVPQLQGEYVDLKTVVDVFGGNIVDILNANSYAIGVEAEVLVNGTIYSVTGNVLLSNGDLHIQAVAKASGVNAIAIDAKICNNTAYLDIAGIKVAIPMTTGTAIDIESLYGYHPIMDGVLDSVQEIMASASTIEIVDLIAMVTSVVMVDNSIEIQLDLSKLSLDEVTITIASNDNITVAVDSITLGQLKVTAEVDLIATTQTVVEPNAADYTTDLAVRIDNTNTVYLNLDIYNGVYKARLGELYLEIAGKTFYIHYDQLDVKGNVDSIQDIITQIEKIAEDYFNKPSSNPVDLSQLIDIASILNSLQLVVGDNVSIIAQLMGLEVQLVVDSYGQLDHVALPELLGKNITVRLTSPKQYYDFSTQQEYVEIEQLFADYFDTLVSLVTTNSWHFQIRGAITVGETKYFVNSGTIDLVYFDAVDYSLSAKLDIHQDSGSGYVPYIVVNVALVDGRIYADYRNVSNNSTVEVDNQLKLSVSIEAIKQCASLITPLTKVIPQLGELIDSILAAMSEAESNAQDIDYSTILKGVSYHNQVFSLAIDGSVFVSNLSDINLAISKSGEGIALALTDFAYNSVSISSLSVEVTAQSAEQGRANIGQYDVSQYNNFDSLFELLSALVVTADDNTFHITGTITAKLVVTVTMNVDLRVDIDDNGDVYVALKLVRPKIEGIDITNLAFIDYGGNSYLYYNGANDTMRVVRDSYIKPDKYCSKCSNFTCNSFWHGIYRGTTLMLSSENQGNGCMVDYDSNEMPSTEFTNNFLDYLMKMINFKDWITNLIMEQISKPSTSVYGIEDVFKSYDYSNNTFGVNVDLKPINKDLGPLNINIGHDDSYTLTSLIGNVSMLSDWCNISFDLLLTESPFGYAKQYSTGRVLF